MRALLKLQTCVIFSGHPKYPNFKSHNVGLKAVIETFPCVCHRIDPLLNITLSADNPHICLCLWSQHHSIRLSSNNIKILFPIFVHSSPLPIFVLIIRVCVLFQVYICITPKSYYLSMFNNKIFNVSLITAFNDLPIFINFIFKKFDRFPDKFTLTTPLPIINGVWFNLPQNCQVNILFYQLQTQMLG